MDGGIPLEIIKVSHLIFFLTFLVMSVEKVFMHSSFLCTICPIPLDPFSFSSYYIKFLFSFAIKKSIYFLFIILKEDHFERDLNSICSDRIRIQTFSK